jgi:hypothetical protein
MGLCPVRKTIQNVCLTSLRSAAFTATEYNEVFSGDRPQSPKRWITTLFSHGCSFEKISMLDSRHTKPITVKHSEKHKKRYYRK